MKKQMLIVICLVSFSCLPNEEKTEMNNHENHSESHTPSEQGSPLSPHTSTMITIAGAHIHIDYSAPSVRNRIIFGGLLAYDEVWQAGAHMATWLETTKDLTIADKILPKGKYGFFVIPRQNDDWTIIINTNWNQHGKDDYNEKEDVIRFRVNPEVSDYNTEKLEYTITQNGETEGVISLSWERITLRFPFFINQ